ncbi:MAG: RelA/SpoT family protein [Acidiferrobacterales bacterium]
MTTQAKSSSQTRSNPARPTPSRSTTRHSAESLPERDGLIDDLCERLESYLEPKQVANVHRAYVFGAEAHEGQLRRSGEPYIHHPIEVASILAEIRLDAQSIVAAILHDVIEDTETAKEHIASDFGKEVADLVDGVSKISQIEFKTKEEEQAENFRKMLLAMGRDIRVILIKLADRLHNMRTLGALPRNRQREIARETLDIYAPIANRLGMRQWYHELEDLGFACLYPLRHRILAEAIQKRRGNRRAIVEKIRRAVLRQLEQEGLNAEVFGREKNLYSIYRKMRQKRLSFDQVYDVYGFRIVVDKVDTCYRALGVIHNLYKPIPGKFKDYIAIPKANGYQSLHTVVFGPFGVSVEIQVRTEEMNRVADLGVASHWLYKSGDTSNDRIPARTLHWLRDLLDVQQKAGNPREFLENLKGDLFSDEVYVFTPNGEIKKLPQGATVIDFAYAVHTDVGNHCISARINHELVPPRTVLRNGDHVEVITAEWATPNPVWLDFVVTGKARAHIRNFLKNQKHEEAARLGERLLGRAVQAMGIDLAKVKEAQKKVLLKKLKLKTWGALLSEIGLGNRLAPVVARQLGTDGTDDGGQGKQRGKRPALAIRGTEGVVVTYGRCCGPVPGDPIIGFLSAGRGIVVHTQECRNLTDYRKHPEKWIDLQWEENIERAFPVHIRVEVRNKRGVLASVAAAIADTEANIDTLSFDERDGEYRAMNFTVEVRDRLHLAQIMRRIRMQDEVIRLNRKKG